CAALRPPGAGSTVGRVACVEAGGEADGAPRSGPGGVRREAGRAGSETRARRAPGGNGCDARRAAARHRGALRGTARGGGAHRSYARAHRGVGPQRGPLRCPDDRKEAGGESEASRGRDPDPSDRARPGRRVPARTAAGARAHALLVFDPLRARARGCARARGGAVRGASAWRPRQDEARLLTSPGSAGGGGRQAARVAAGILVTRVLGYVRERVFAYYFGNDSIPADAFRAALRIPNTIRSLLGEGTLLGSFIPVYAALNERSDKSAARAVARATLGLLFLGAGILAVLGTAF